MNIKTYVRDHLTLPADAKDSQFAVLAFDLDPPGPTGHAPPTKPSFSEGLTANGPSGPWCVAPHNYSPIADPRRTESGRVLIAKDRQGEDTVIAPGKESYGDRETIHAERSLVARLHLYFRNYQQINRTLPKSVSLYTHYSPCRHCIGLLRQLPQAGGVPLWSLAYTLPYVSRSGESGRAETDYYPDSKSAIEAAETLRGSGWVIL